MNKPFLCTVDPSYLTYLRAADKHVSQKPGRPFVANVIELNGFQYAVPLTTQIIPASGKPRQPMYTSFIPDSHNNTVAALLYNNMIPVTDKNITKIDVNNTPVNMLLTDQARFIRNNDEKIAHKAEIVYTAKARGNNALCNMICCDYKALEKQCKIFNQTQENSENMSKGITKR